MSVYLSTFLSLIGGELIIILNISGQSYLCLCRTKEKLIFTIYKSDSNRTCVVMYCIVQFQNAWWQDIEFLKTTASFPESCSDCLDG